MRMRRAATYAAIAIISGAPGSPSLAAPEPLADIHTQFALQGLDGRPVTQQSYPGRWLLVYFGYTFCPDVCPTVLVSVGHALDSLGPLADRIQIVFVTVDPARDTAAHLTRYLSAFSPRIVGLRGDAQQLEAAAKQFHVYYRPRSLGDGDYAIDHSSFLYVVAPDGRLVKVLPDSIPQSRMATELKRLLQGEP